MQPVKVYCNLNDFKNQTTKYCCGSSWILINQNNIKVGLQLYVTFKPCARYFIEIVKTKDFQGDKNLREIDIKEDLKRSKLQRKGG